MELSFYIMMNIYMDIFFFIYNFIAYNGILEVMKKVYHFDEYLYEYMKSIGCVNPSGFV